MAKKKNSDQIKANESKKTSAKQMAKDESQIDLFDTQINSTMVEEISDAEVVETKKPLAENEKEKENNQKKEKAENKNTSKKSKTESHKKEKKEEDQAKEVTSEEEIKVEDVKAKASKNDAFKQAKEKEKLMKFENNIQFETISEDETVLSPIAEEEIEDESQNLNDTIPDPYGTKQLSYEEVKNAKDFESKVKHPIKHHISHLFIAIKDKVFNIFNKKSKEDEKVLDETDSIEENDIDGQLTNQTTDTTLLNSTMQMQPLRYKGHGKHKILIPPVERYSPDLNTGLNDDQVNVRILQSLVNKIHDKTDKSIWSILVHNTFTFFNMLLLSIAVLLMVFGLYNQLMFMVMAIVNTVIGIYQEIKAKRKLDQLKLVTEANVKVLRNGKESVLPTSQLVLDDLYRLSNGDQIPADSIVMDGLIEVNESLITGESNSIRKDIGDKVFAGSFVVSGSALLKANKVGDQNYASSIQSKAKQLNKPKSELVKSMNAVIKVIAIIILPLGGLTFFTQYVNQAKVMIDQPVFEICKKAFESTSGSMIGMIPSGMYLLISIALAKSVMTLSSKNAMVQDLYSVEMLARIDTLCLDKTGTLTDGTMRVDEMLVIDNHYDLADLVGSYLNAFSEVNQTSIALSQKFPLKNVFKPIDNIPFSSQRKYSAVEFKNNGTFILGAPEYVYRGRDQVLIDYIKTKQELGYRVVMMSKVDSPIENGEIKGKFSPIVVFILEDHIRLEAKDTIKWFTDNGVNIKIISGDNPLTAAEIATKCGVPNAENCISLEGLSDREVIQIVNDYTVFGRVTPEQKAILVREMKNQGHTVGMTGDGVNDILAMKSADCSVAMANGASAARNVAHLVLLDSNFASMPLAVAEGRRSINNVQRSSALYLMKTIFTVVFTIIVLLTFTNNGNGIDYPFKPNNLIIMESICIGLSSIFLALQKDDQPITGHFLKNTFIRAIPAGLCLIFAIAVNYILCYTGDFLEISGIYQNDPNKAKLAFTTFCSLSMVVISMAMSYNCFLPITPLKKNGARAGMFAAVLVVGLLMIFVLPFIPFTNGNLCITFAGIDFREMTKPMWLILCIYAVGANPALTTTIRASAYLTSSSSLINQQIAANKKKKQEEKEAKEAEALIDKEPANVASLKDMKENKQTTSI